MTFGTVRYILPGQDLCLHSIHIFGTYGACVQARMDLELLRDVIVVGPVQGKKSGMLSKISALDRQRYRHQKWIKLTETWLIWMHAGIRTIFLPYNIKLTLACKAVMDIFE